MSAEYFSPAGNSVIDAPAEKPDENSFRPLPRIAAIHDLSCYGRCALTVVMPVLSAMGYQVVPIPTALLSTHTGGFTDLHFLDLTSSMQSIGAHFDALDLKFDAIYTGFLGNAAQIGLVKSFMTRFADADTTVMVDPVMGDDGVLYATYTHELMKGMKDLCHHAKIITPNLTEACFLTGIPYKNTQKMSEEEVFEYAARLGDSLGGTGAEKIVITGLSIGNDQLGMYGFDRFTSAHMLIKTPRIRKNYPGTGDLFASVLLGSLMRNRNFESAIAFAADFTSRVMSYSADFPVPTRSGVAFEAFLGDLIPHSPEKELSHGNQTIYPK